MNQQTTTTPHQLRRLARLFREHEEGSTAFANSIGAAFGWSSRLGRLAERQTMRLPSVATQLQFTAEDLDGSVVANHEYQARGPSTAAQGMEAAKLRRPTMRLVPMPEPTRRAALDFLAERLELLDQAAALLVKARAEKRLLTAVRRDRDTTRRLAEALRQQGDDTGRGDGTADTILALHQAVEAERRQQRTGTLPEPLDLRAVADKPLPQRHEALLDDAPKRPVETAAREHVRALGLELAITGGIERMRAAWEAVASRDGRAASWLDHAWDGLVAADGRWVA